MDGVGVMIIEYGTCMARMGWGKSSAEEGNGDYLDSIQIIFLKT